VIHKNLDPLGMRQSKVSLIYYENQKIQKLNSASVMMICGQRWH